MLNTSYYESLQDTLTDNIVTTNGSTNYPSHFHKKIEITYVEKGSCASIIAQNTFNATADDILYVPEYYSHSYVTSNDVIRQVFLPTESLTGDIKNITEKHSFPLLMDDKVFNSTHILPILQNILHIQDDPKINKTAKTLLIKGCTTEFFGWLYQGYGHKLIVKNKKLENFAAILIYIDENYCNDISLESISKAFNYNKYYFSKLFNQNTNTSLQNYINTLRVKNFLKRYKKGDLNIIKNLAFEVGFNSMPSFYRAFKQVYGISPKDYFKE